MFFIFFIVTDIDFQLVVLDSIGEIYTKQCKTMNDYKL